MRIAYIAPYQGPVLLKRRPTVKNLALAGNVKIELIAELLRGHHHDVEVLSQGEVVERGLNYYSAFSETTPFDSSIPVHYASSLPIRFVNGWWSSQNTLALFKRRHRARPFDLVIVYNLKLAQVACARYAVRELGLPVVVEYEDDAFVDVGGQAEERLTVRWQLRRAQEILGQAAGCVGASPHLLSRFSASLPRLLLRGVVSEDILACRKKSEAERVRRNWVVFSGTLFRSKGLEPLIKGWQMVRPRGWELHIAGHGELAEELRALAGTDPSIAFHGLLDRKANAAFLNQAKIGINPHNLSHTPGNVFAFKIIEYLAAGTHVVTTPMGTLEPELERGITYMPDNSPETIAATLQRVIDEGTFERGAAQAAEDTYGPRAVASSLNKLVNEVVDRRRSNRLAQPDYSHINP